MPVSVIDWVKPDNNHFAVSSHQHDCQRVDVLGWGEYQWFLHNPDSPFNQRHREIFDWLRDRHDKANSYSRAEVDERTENLWNALEWNKSDANQKFNSLLDRGPIEQLFNELSDRHIRRIDEKIAELNEVLRKIDKCNN